MKHDPEDDDITPLHSCVGCSYYKSDPDRCPAFPEGIPEEIGTGKLNHDRVFPGQVGDFVFRMFHPPVLDNPDYGAPPWFGPDSTSD